MFQRLLKIKERKLNRLFSLYDTDPKEQMTVLSFVRKKFRRLNEADKAAAKLKRRLVYSFKPRALLAETGKVSGKILPKFVKARNEIIEKVASIGSVAIGEGFSNEAVKSFARYVIGDTFHTVFVQTSEDLLGAIQAAFIAGAENTAIGLHNTKTREADKGDASAGAAGASLIPVGSSGNLYDTSAAQAVQGVVNIGTQMKALSLDYLRKRFYEKGTIAEFADNYADMVSGVVADLYEEGIAWDDISRGVRTLLSDTGMEDYQIERILRTELARAAHEGSLTIARQSDLDMVALFIVSDEACEDCKALAADNYYELEDAEVDNLPHPNCEDSWNYLTRDEADKMEGEE